MADIEQLIVSVTELDIATTQRKKRTSPRRLSVDEIFRPNEEGVSEWISRERLEPTRLKLSNNGNQRHGVFYGDNRYIWETQRGERNKITALRTNGLSDVANGDTENRPIKDEIRQALAHTPCVACGQTSDLVVDHKNDLYNDPRVLDRNTQTLDDFQSLCNSCNLKKRQVCRRTKETGRRYGATNIPSLAVFDIDFTSGDETFDPNDVDAMKGTYWYDPVEFMTRVRDIFRW